MFLLQVDEKTSMRMLNASDAKDLFLLIDRSRTALRKWLSWVDQTKTVEDSLQFIINSFNIYSKRKGMTAGIFYQKELAGIAGFNEIDWANRIGYIGYWLDIEYQGYGIMTRVVKALTNYAFDCYKLNRIDIRVANNNKKSQAIPERLGYKREGVLREAEWLYDHYVDHVVYSMLKSEWKER